MGSEPEAAAAMRRILRRVNGAMEREREIEVAFPTELNVGFQLKTRAGRGGSEVRVEGLNGDIRMLERKA